MTTLLFDRSVAQGRLELTDRDRLDLLHRMSTNDVKNLPPGQGQTTVLTTALARIIDHVIIYHWGRAILMITNRPGTVRSWLQKHVFWQDRIKIRDVSAELAQLEVYGPTAGQIAAQFVPGAPALPLHHFLETTVEEMPLLVARTFALKDEGFRFMMPVELLEAVRGRILRSASQGDNAQYERLRVEAGLPGAEHELTEEYIPLEAGLWDAVSFSKGCYIGQEIIARMESRNRLAKTLIQVRICGKATSGAALLANGEKIGTLTSVVPGEDGIAVGLGFVKPEHAEPGTALSVAAEGGATVSAEVTTAPLIQNRSIP